ncbi:family 2 glycosyl transferase [Blastococcus sp. TF02-09]|uniref:glycosyltransferase n=1 Tax=Blastococcus sp. TF02-09 TaxID=2250576 RepID=UPI000DEAFD28|nr:glycosyltransferase [Blastococcus sp. TF02-9]RBY78014.1 family 2 glycosyl transferase [Blastococcus sp. TF02-9]
MLHDRPTRPPLAVVVVTFNSAGVLPACLRSVDAALTEAGLGGAPVVVVDNASSDGTLAVAESAPGVRVVALPTNGGFAAGVNAGLGAVPGHDVLILNPDVRLDARAVDLLRRRLDVPGTGIAVPRLLDTDGELQLSLRRRPTALRAVGEALLGGFRAGRWAPLGELVSDECAYAVEQQVDWATGAVWLVSAECIATIGLLDERYFLYSEETEYMLRAGAAGFAVQYEPEASAVHVGGEQSTSPYLWALSVTNRVRMQRELHGPAAAARMWLGVLLNELSRAALRGSAGGATHRAALRELSRMRRWPRRPDEGSGPAWVCFAAQDWWYHNTAHSDFQLMRSMAETRRVLVVNSIGMRMPTPGRGSTHVTRRVLRKLRSVAKLVRRPLPDLPGFHVMSPLPLPFYGSSVTRAINAAFVRAQVRLVCLLLGIRTPVIMVTIPTAWDVVAPMRRTALVYNRSDRHSEFPEGDRAALEGMEEQLLAHSDSVLYVSRELMAEESASTGDRAAFIDHGVDTDHFRPRPRSEQPADVLAIPGPRVGFFGALDDYLVDFDLLEDLAAELPDVSLVLIGDATYPMDRFEAYPNVHWLGRKAYEEIPAYGSAFDVAIMPWIDSTWIHRSNPIKLKEYLALGLPVVSTWFAELDGYLDRVRLAKGAPEFAAAVRDSLELGPLQAPDELRASVLPYSWHSRAAVLRESAEG